jgi:hypothetical protein
MGRRFPPRLPIARHPQKELPDTPLVRIRGADRFLRNHLVPRQPLLGYSESAILRRAVIATITSTRWPAGTHQRGAEGPLRSLSHRPAVRSASLGRRACRQRDRTNTRFRPPPAQDVWLRYRIGRPSMKCNPPVARAGAFAAGSGRSWRVGVGANRRRCAARRSRSALSSGSAARARSDGPSCCTGPLIAARSRWRTW